MSTLQSFDKPAFSANLRLKFLTQEQIVRIDELLSTVGEYGEVHLIVQKSELRYINRVESFKAWNDKQK
jgi:hypothetical protein